MTPREYVQFKTNAARAATIGPGVGGIRGLGQISGPQFQDANGNVISSIACGGTYVFNVPGYSTVHLILTKNGLPDFDGGFDVPMAPYQSNCMTDPGVYQATAYDPQSGTNLGTTTFIVQPPTSATGLLAGLTPTEIAIGAGLILLLLSKRKKKKAA